MISKEKLTSAISRLRLMRGFPHADADLIAALAAELRDACADEETLDAAVNAVVRGDDYWPGVYAVRKAAATYRRKREAAADFARAEELRAAHEANCPGFKVSIDERNRVVHCDRCRVSWPGDPCSDYPDRRELSCRRGNTIDVDSIAEAEVLRRGHGWITGTEQWNRTIAEFNASVSRSLAERRSE